MLIEMEIASSPYIEGDEKLTRTYAKIEKEIFAYLVDKNARNGL